MANLKVATFNVNSLRARMAAVLDWLDKEKPDLLALQETKVADGEFPAAALEAKGWRAAFKGQKGHNGVALISRQPLANVVAAVGTGDGEAEARFIAADCKGVRVYNTYIPQGFQIDSPKYQSKLKFFAGLKRYFDQRVQPATPALWLGDLNVAQEEIDLARPKANRDHVCFHVEAREALRQARGKLWIDLFRERHPEPGQYTFWSMRYGAASFKNNVGWRVDLILGTKAMAERLQKIWIDTGPRARPGSSDHTFLAAEFSA